MICRRSKQIEFAIANRCFGGRPTETGESSGNSAGDRRTGRHRGETVPGGGSRRGDRPEAKARSFSVTLRHG